MKGKFVIMKGANMLKKIYLLLSIIFVGLNFGQQVSGDSLLKMLEKAKLYYNSGEYENAIKQLESALQYLKQLTQNEQVEAYKYLAFSYVAFGDKEKAKEQFKKALVLDPKIELDPATVSPKIIKVFEEAKAELAVSPPSPPPVQQPPPTKPTKPVVKPAGVSTTGALLRSCCLPGWGQWYKGESSKGTKIMIASGVTLTTALIANLYRETKRKEYLDIPPDSIDEMNRAYREYRTWYNIANYTGLSFIAVYLYNLYDVIFTKPLIKSSMNEFDKGIYCRLAENSFQFGYNVRIK